MAGSALQLPGRIRLVEVGLRDGLQAVTQPLPTSAKVALVELLLAAGLREIEAVSFAHPAVLPQLADAEQVMAAVPRPPGVVYRGLVPNAQGARRAAGCGLNRIVAVVSADDEMSRRNQRRGTSEVLAELPRIGAAAREGGAQLVVAVACAFFAPARGPVPRAEMDRVVDGAVDAGASGVYLAATTGMEHAREIADGIGHVRQRHPGLEIGVHLHNRNGQALANAVVAMQAGVDWLEAAFCGLGGDLWFPGDPAVLGNAAMEDLLVLCDDLGVATGVSLGEYLRVSERAAALTGRPSVSHVTRGGSRADLAASQWPDTVTTAGHPSRPARHAALDPRRRQ